MRTIRTTAWNLHAVLVAFFLIALLLRGYGLSEQPALDDEAGAASSAYNYVKTGNVGQVAWQHPPLRNIIIFVSEKLLGGYTAWGLRGGSLIFGSLTVPLLGYLAYSLFKSRRMAFLAAFFLCIDPIHISASRQALQETTTIFFVVAGALAGYHAVRKDSLLFCYLSGTLFGFAIASKWHGFFSLGITATAYVIAPWVIKDHPGDRQISYRILTLIGAFTAVPAVIYIAVYLPWLNRGHSLWDFARFQAGLIQYQYHHVGTLYSETRQSIRAYEWFIMPVAWVDFVAYRGKAYLNIAMGNFLIWGLTLPSLYFSAKTWIKERDFELGFLLALFFAQYAPLLVTSRSIWVFLPPVIQYAFILTAFSIVHLMGDGTLSRRALVIYLCFVIALSLVMYPMATMRALDYEYLRPLADYYSPHKL